MAVPIYVLVISFFLFVFRVVYAEEIVTEALGKTAREAATLIEEDSLANRVILEGLFRKNIDTPDFVQNLNLLESSVENNVIILRAGYRMNFPIDFFGLKKFSMTDTVAERCFNGYKSGTINEDPTKEYVYITKSGGAYHSSSSCNYLDLSIHTITAVEISNVRNYSGGKYNRCRCAKQGQTVYYITNYGVNYHGSLECSGLKRTIYRVTIDEVEGRHPCGKCYGG